MGKALLFSLLMALVFTVAGYVERASAEVPSIVSLDDVNGNGKPEVSVLMQDSVDGKNYAYVVDASDGAQISEILFGDGGTIPTPISQTVVPDFDDGNGGGPNGADEIAMLGVRPDDGAVVVFINDASTGSWIQTLGFDADFPPVAMAVVPDMDGNGISEIAVLGVNFTNGKVMVLIKDASTNGWIPSLTFDANYPPSAMKVVEYANGTVGIAVLGVNPDSGQVKVVLRDVSTRNKIGNAIYFGSDYPPIDMAVVPGINGNSEPEIAVLGVNSTDGNVRVLVRDASSGDKVNAVFFGGSFSPVAMAVVPDINGSGYPEIAVLGRNPTNGNAKVVIKDASSGDYLPSLGFGSDYPPVGIMVLPDMDGNGISEIAVLVMDSAGGKLAVVIKDASSDALINKFYVPLFTGVTGISAGYHHSMTLKTDGTVWAWGRNSSGELGDGTTTNRYTPVQVSGLTDVIGIAARGGYYGGHSIALKIDGTVWSWGFNMLGTLGDGTTTHSSLPLQVCAVGETAPCSSFLTNVTAIAAGSTHSMALKTDGTVWAWGGNRYGQLGATTTETCDTDGYTFPGYLYPCSTTPVQVLTDVTAISAGRNYSMALKTDGTVWAWGNNYYGQMGDGTTTDSNVPLQVCAEGETAPCSSWLTGVTAISAGGIHSMAVKADGTVWAWGNNRYGRLGDGTTTDSTTPVQVSGLTDVTGIAAGGGYYDGHSMALKADGTVWTWGSNNFGQLGDGTTTSSYVPLQVCAGGETTPCSSFLTDVTGIAAGGGLYDGYSMALKADGTVWAWGYNGAGQLGDGTTASRSTSVVVVESTP